MSTIYNHIYHIYLYVCIMSKQILNIVFPPPTPPPSSVGFSPDSGLKTGQVTSLTAIFVDFSPESGLQPGVQVTKEVEVDGDGAGHSIKLELFF